jgi:hypothetical protein
MRRVVLTLSFTFLSLACSAGTENGATTEVGSSSTSTSGGTAGANGEGGGGAGFGFGGSTGEGGSGLPTVDEVYGHSPSTLYRLDPQTKQVTVVGSFGGCDSNVIDIALDADSNMYATSFGGLHRVDRSNAVCTPIADGSYPNSLSFVPAGTLDPSVEALVGYQGSTYVRIDPTSGTITNVGSLGGGYASSGDIVSVKGGGTYLTVTGQGCGDCLVEVNPSNGALVKNWGPVGHSQVFGLAFWGGRAYGFSNAGALFEVSFGSDTVTSVLIDVPNAPAGLQFWGAGSSTSVPLVVPQ